LQITVCLLNYSIDIPGGERAAGMAYRLISIFTAATAVLAGCAKLPETIKPSYISHMAFADWSCEMIKEDNYRTNQALQRASSQQTNANTTDTVAVMLIGLPVASLSGDNIAPEIARLKGVLNAQYQAYENKHCPGSKTASLKSSVS
jgi:hypothetical protein